MTGLSKVWSEWWVEKAARRAIRDAAYERAAQIPDSYMKQYGDVFSDIAAKIRRLKNEDLE